MVELQQGDCLELMKKIPDASIDMVLCDLPYGVTNCKWDVRIPLAPLWEQYKRVIKERGAIVLFGIEPFASELRTSNLKMYRYDWTWYKHYVRGFLNARKRPLRTTERILVFAKKAPAYYPIMRKGVMRNKGGAGNTGGYIGILSKLRPETTRTTLRTFLISKVAHPIGRTTQQKNRLRYLSI